MADDNSDSPFVYSGVAPTPDPIKGTGGDADEKDVNKQLFDQKPQAPPADQTGTAGSPEKAEVDQAKALVDEKIKAKEHFHRQSEDALANVERARQAYTNTILNSKVDSGIPEKWPEIDKAPADAQKAAIQVNQVWPAIVGLGMAIAGMAGKHGITQGFFLGGMMQAYGKGMQENAREMRDNWWDQVKYQHQLAEERLQNYRAALADQRFTETQKLDIVKTYADEYKDKRMMEADSLKEVHQAVHDYENAQKRYLKEAHKTLGAVDFLMKGTADSKAYAEAAVDKYRRKYGHLPGNETEQAQALDEYPLTQWSKEHPKKGSTDAKIDPATGKVIPGGSGDSVFGVGDPNPATPDQRKAFEDLRPKAAQQPKSTPSPSPEEDSNNDTSDSSSLTGQSLLG
jgi:hypothetical protein